jgi:hypothetical protein
MEYGRQKEYQKEYFQRPGAKEKRREYRQRPEVKERRREYRQRPEVKEKRRERYQRNKERGNRNTPWVREGIPEVEYAHALTFLPEFQRGVVQVNNELIALELNIEYHDCEEVRTARAVQVCMSNYRKSLENRV